MNRHVGLLLGIGLAATTAAAGPSATSGEPEATSSSSYRASLTASGAPPAASILASGCDQDMLYASDGQNLYTIDPATGAETLIGSHGLDDEVGGMTFDEGGRLLGLTFGSGVFLVEIDAATGAAGVVGPTGLDFVFEGGLEFDGSGTLLGLDEGLSGGARTFSLDPDTGAATLISNPQERDVNGLAWDGSTMWAIDRVTNSLGELNTANGVYVARFGLGPFVELVGGLAWDPVNSILYAVFSGEGALFRLDTGNGTDQRIGPVSGVTALAFCHCEPECPLASCGNGVVEAGEACDDANSDPTDLCDDCLRTFCGDGVVQAPNGEGAGGPAGDGVELCDDGNTDPADQCASDCSPTSCGDGVVQVPNGEGAGGPMGDGMELCDDGNADPGDQCAGDCSLTFCGDGLVQSPNGEGAGGPMGDGVELCDDGNADPADRCAGDCSLTFCGDGVMQLPNGEGTGGPLGNGMESCDDGNADPGDQCAGDCSLTFCGDGVVQSPNGEQSGGPDGNGVEECDDGNDVPDDGCTQCEVDVPMSVSWSSIEAACETGGVEILWTTSDERDSWGFRVWRAESREGPWSELPGLVVASGAGSRYGYRDEQPRSGERWYRLEEICLAGVCSWSPPLRAEGCAETLGGARVRGGSSLRGPR